MLFYTSTDRKIGAEGVLATLSLKSFPSFNYHYMNKIFHLEVSLYLECEAPKLVRVKAYKRNQHGKVVKVRSYYRRIWERQ